MITVSGLTGHSYHVFVGDLMSLSPFLLSKKIMVCPQADGAELAF